MVTPAELDVSYRRAGDLVARPSGRPVRAIQVDRPTFGQRMELCLQRLVLKRLYDAAWFAIGNPETRSVLSTSRTGSRTRSRVAGSMRFVYLNIVWFSGLDHLDRGDPWPTLTMIVSLEAIFLSTFVMISQNRADEKRQVLATQEWQRSS